METMKTLKALFTVFVAVALGAVLVTAQTPAAADLYQEALRFQEVKGDLGKAIELYRIITTRYGADLAIAPKAMLRLAECYEILSPPDAIKTYRELIAKFPDAAEPVTAARARLAGLVPPQIAEPSPRLLSAVVGGAGVSALADVSADGKHLLLNQTPHLMLRSLATGQTTRLVEGSMAAAAFGGKLSPDGRLVAYEWRELPAGSRGPGFASEFRSSIRLKPVQGGAAGEVILPAFDGRSQIAWFPDGASILAGIHPANGVLRELRRVPINGTPAKVIASFPEERRVNWLRLSPDGRWIAFEAQPQGSGGQTYVYVIAADGTSERPVIQTAAHNRPLGWTDDGSHLLFSSDRDGAERALWAVSWSAGGATGTPFLVSKTDLYDGTPRAGSFYYAQNKPAGSVVSVIAGSGAGARATQTFNGGGAVWSPDGRRIAFLQRRAGTPNGLVIRSADTGEERTYPQAVGIGPEHPRWLPTGNAILLQASPNPDGTNQGLYRLDLGTGQFTRLFDLASTDHVRSSRFAVSADGTRTYHTVRPTPTAPWTGIVAVRLADGVEEPVAQFPGAGFAGTIGLAASPDGTRVAVHSVGERPEMQARVIVAHTDGAGPLQVSQPFTGRIPIAPIAWTSDSQHVLVPFMALEGTWGVRRLAASEMTMTDAGLGLESLLVSPPTSLEVNPVNGRLLVVTGNTQMVEIWVLDRLVAYLRSR